MSQIDFSMNIPKLQGESGKSFVKTVQKEQLTAMFDLKPVLSEGEKRPEPASGEALKIIIQHYDGNGELTVSGGFSAFPEYVQAGLSTLFADLKLLGLIASFALDINGWSLVLTANGLAYFDVGQKPLKKGTALLRKLPSNTGKLLTAIVDSDDPAEMLRDCFERSGYDEDGALLGMLRELVGEGYIRVPIWKDDIPQYVEIDESARDYEPREDESQVFHGSLANFSAIHEALDCEKEKIPMKLGATVYVSNSIEAVAFYMEAFGLTLGYHETNADGTFWHAALLRDGVEIFAVSESRNEKLAAMMRASTPAAHPTIGIGLNFENEDEVRKAYDMLKDGGSVLYPIGTVPWSPCSAEVIDKYGVDWCIYVPAARE